MGLFGGGNSSSSNTSNNYDQRQIVTTTTDNYDLSNRSINNSSYDLSNRSSSTNSNNTTVYNTTTDGGAVSGALAVAGNAVQAGVQQLAGVLGLASQVVTGQNAALASGYDYADHLFSGVMDTVNKNTAATQNAFNLAAQLDSSAVNQLQGAYADAKGTSDAQSKIMIGVLLVAALAVLGPRLGK
jgi:hypothetical protein